MELRIERTDFAPATSSGRLLIDGEYFCETLEDAARAYGVKCPGQTCLPPGVYHVTINHSQRFGRPMILVFTNPDDLSCEHGGIRFTGVRMHGGNTHENTEGCPLVAFDRISVHKIARSAEAALFERVKTALEDGQSVLLVIVNVTPAGTV